MFKYNRSWLLKRLIGFVPIANWYCSELIFLCKLAVDRKRAGSSGRHHRTESPKEKKIPLSQKLRQDHVLLVLFKFYADVPQGESASYENSWDQQYLCSLVEPWRKNPNLLLSHRSPEEKDFPCEQWLTNQNNNVLGVFRESVESLPVRNPTYSSGCCLQC